MGAGRHTLEEKLEYAIEKRKAAEIAMGAATAVRENAREMSGGLLSFGGSGPQRAAQQVKATFERSFRGYAEAKERFDHWDYKARSYARRIAERDRVLLTREDVLGATHVRLSTGWWKVAKVNATTVSVETGYSWTDRHQFAKILEVRTIA